MVRVRHAGTTHKRKKRVLKQTKGQFAQKHTRYRQAKRSLIKGLTYAFRDRKVKKRQFRQLWIVRINAACQEAGITYSRFMKGIKQARILQAEGEAQAIQSVNEAAEKYFVGNAQILRKIEMVEKALEHNAKIVVPSNTELVNVIGDMAGILPLKKEEK